MRAETNQINTEAEYDPNAGGVGYLTFNEYDRLVRAVANARTHVPWWRIAGHIRLGDPDEYKTRSSDPAIPLPATWLAAEEISNLLIEINSVPTLVDAAKQLPDMAMTLTREVETAVAKWPMSDRPHKVRYLRCRACQQLTLKYFPPKFVARADAVQVTQQIRHRDGTTARVPLLDVVVRCTNRACSAVEDPGMFERDALLIRLEAEHGSRGRLDKDKRGTRTGEPLTVDGVQVGA